MKVFLATPMYNGIKKVDGQEGALSISLLPPFRESLQKSLTFLKDKGIFTRWQVQSGCCYLPITRNKMVRTFLEMDFTDFVFLDEDVSWEPEDLMRLLSCDVDIVAGIYPYKTPEEGYPVRLRSAPGSTRAMREENGLIDAWTVPTGFMRIRRSVFDEMEKFYGEDLIVDEYDPDGKFSETYLNFFDTVKIGRRWCGEDWNFCRRWTEEMGNRLWVLPDIDLAHWQSDVPHYGNLHKWLLKQPGVSKDPERQVA